MISRGFLDALGNLLSLRIVSAHPLASGTFRLRLEGGGLLILKSVPRQDWDAWRPGRPWTELVALDALSACGAPVPRLLAADVEHGWLVEEHVEGSTLDDPRLQREEWTVFRALVDGMERLERGFDEAASDLEAYVLRPSGEASKLVLGVGRLLPPSAARAWRELADLAGALAGECAPAGVLGPVDVQAQNAIYTPFKDVCFLDLATVGTAPREKRLAAYAQSVVPQPRSLLTPEAYAWYQRTRGKQDALRLAFHDLLYWGLAYSRLAAAKRHPESPAGRWVRRTWGSVDSLWNPVVAMWRRFRLEDARVERVLQGLEEDGA